MSEIFSRLKKERERLKLNQQQLGAIGGVARNAQSHYESGTRLPDAGYFSAIASVGADVQYFLTGIQSGAIHSNDLSTEESALVDNYRASTDKNKSHIEAVSVAFSQHINSDINQA